MNPLERHQVLWFQIVVLVESNSPVQSQNLVTHFLLVWRKPKKTSFVNIKILYIHGDVLTA